MSLTVMGTLKYITEDDQFPDHLRRTNLMLDDLQAMTIFETDYVDYEWR